MGLFLLSKWTEAIPGVSGAEATFWQWEDFPAQPPGTGWEKRRERSYMGMVLLVREHILMPGLCSHDMG